MTRAWNFFKKTFVFVCVIFSLLSLAHLALSAISRNQGSYQDIYQELELFTDALSFVQDEYVQETKPKDLIYGALAGLLGHLDPHSQFLLPEEYEELKIDTEGKFGGIGIEITMKDDLVTVVTPIEDAPAWKAGIVPMDRIVKIDDVLVKNFTLNDAVKKLRGKPGTEVRIVVWREKDKEFYSLRLKRAFIDVKDIKEARLIEGAIGYLRLVEFREGTPQELDRVLKNLKAEGLKGLVIDLRNNPGGLLDKAIETTQRFLEPGSLIVTVRGRDPKQTEEFKSSWRAPDLVTALVILVNEGSASGSEIMAGALQDHKRAFLLGTTTFGKGSVQTVLPLRDGSALKLTTSHYYTPSGRSIHDKGITPDIVVEDTAALEDPARAPGDVDEIFDRAAQKIPEAPAPLQPPRVSKSYKDDAPLARAVDLLRSSLESV